MIFVFVSNCAIQWLFFFFLDNKYISINRTWSLLFTKFTWCRTNWRDIDFCTSTWVSIVFKCDYSLGGNTVWNVKHAPLSDLERRRRAVFVFGGYCRPVCVCVFSDMMKSLWQIQDLNDEGKRNSFHSIQQRVKWIKCDQAV